jgi:hypothetical protein
MSNADGSQECAGAAGKPMKFRSAKRRLQRSTSAVPSFEKIDATIASMQCN